MECAKERGYMLLEVQVPRKLRQLSLRQVRLNLGMSQHELATATNRILGQQGIKGVHRNSIYKAERGDPIEELTAMRILMAVNAIHETRGRPTLGIDDITWNISDRKPEKAKDT